MERARVNRICDFLVNAGLCRWEEGHLVPTGRLLSASSSPYHGSFLNAWRVRAIEKLEEHGPEDFSHSEPMSVGAQAFEEINEVLRETIGRIRKILEKHPSDEVACLNIDWFHI